MDINLLLKKHAELLDQGACKSFEEDIEKEDISLDDLTFISLKECFSKFSVIVQIQLKAAVFEKHLTPFSYIQDRINEYTRIEKLYNQEKASKPSDQIISQK